MSERARYLVVQARDQAAGSSRHHYADRSPAGRNQHSSRLLSEAAAPRHGPVTSPEFMRSAPSDTPPRRDGRLSRAGVVIAPCVESTWLVSAAPASPSP